MQGAVVELVWDLYMRLAIRCLNVMMLTNDENILVPMMKMRELFDEDRHDFEVLVGARAFKNLNNERGSTMLERHDSRMGDVAALTVELGTYCPESFRCLDERD